MRSELFNQENLEAEGEGLFVRQNSKMMKVELNQGSVQALAGSMVAYQGEVDFEHQGSKDIASWLTKKVTGEDLPLMRMAGTGEVFLANMGGDVHIITLENDAISINGANILAYTDGLQSDITFMRGAGMLSGGLFNTTLTGTGQVAIVTDGPPVVLEPGQAPTFVDPDAAVCWSANLQPQLKTAIGMKLLIGRSSGEEIQLGFEGDGFVAVQPSENMRFGGEDQGGETPGSQQGGMLGGLLNG